MAAFTVVSRHVLGDPGQTPPREERNVARARLGAKGPDDVLAAASENIVALCDVAFTNAAPAFQHWPRAKPHRDFRKMLKAGKGIGALVVATPKPLHFGAAMWALRHEKRAFGQRPGARISTRMRQWSAGVTARIAQLRHTFPVGVRVRISACALKIEQQQT